MMKKKRPKDSKKLNSDNKRQVKLTEKRET